MGLFEQVTSDATTRLPSHGLGACFREWLLGNLTDRQLQAKFTFDASTVTNLAAVKTKYEGLSTLAQKVQFLFELEDILILWEDGLYTKDEGVAVLMD